MENRQDNLEKRILRLEGLLEELAKPVTKKKASKKKVSKKNETGE